MSLRGTFTKEVTLCDSLVGTVAAQVHYLMIYFYVGPPSNGSSKFKALRTAFRKPRFREQPLVLWFVL